MSTINTQGKDNQVVATQTEKNIKMMLNLRVENAIREILIQQISDCCDPLDFECDLEDINSYPYMLLKVDLKSYYLKNDDEFIKSKIGGLVIDALVNINYGTDFYVYTIGYERINDNEYVADVLVFASDEQRMYWTKKLDKMGDINFLQYLEAKLTEMLSEYDTSSTAKVRRIDPRRFIYV